MKLNKEEIRLRNSFTDKLKRINLDSNILNLTVSESDKLSNFEKELKNLIDMIDKNTDKNEDIF